MKILSWGVMLALTSTWGADLLADVGEVIVDAGASPTCVVKTLVSGADGGEVTRAVVVTCAGKADGEKCCIENCRMLCKGKGVLCVLGDGSESGTSATRRVVVRRVSAGGDGEHVMRIRVMANKVKENEGGGWLGVQMGNVTEALRAQLGDVEGIVVLNVIEDSPAAEAGFEQHDIILEINDEKIGGDLAEMGKRIRQAGPDARMKFTVLRDGERRNVIATLGERSDAKNIWLHRFSPDAELNEVFATKLKILERTEDGAWSLEDLGDLKELKELKGLHGIGDLFFPKFDGKSVKVFINDGQPSVCISVNRDGETIVIEREGKDGEIVVRRESADGEETEQRYEDDEALKAGDEEAYEVFKDGTASCVWIGNQGQAFSFGGDFDFDVTVDLQELTEGLKDLHEGLNHWVFKFDDESDSFQRWQEEIAERLEGAAGKHSEVLEKLKELDLKGLHTWIGRLHDGAGPHFIRERAQARQSIHENEDGTIDVIIRKGDTEVITHYSDIDDLQERNPSAYESYKDLLEDAE
ncbi:MAG: PDZ domain-containing protein [Planctomycetes bacterium]|nr:PDZ domain-containing protein [Planctomycetota bacterium]